ncbi:hypothetical protein DB30_04946 [Enhygromyxa salina]|uniref:eCIS core domain-containing protein n=1 Tax=Enhygromyxa salina TaxID=215803 RepID=A0A0C1ZEH3_9BACT|nr:DUF4157 domain-containing protein [Enhygromyxa salina]KIG16074.1 hypothetical protein DB30_04946 [Enhygromyxa salina]
MGHRPQHATIYSFVVVCLRRRRVANGISSTNTAVSLETGAADNAYEREADAVADAVVGGRTADTLASKPFGAGLTGARPSAVATPASTDHLGGTIASKVAQVTGRSTANATFVKGSVADKLTAALNTPAATQGTSIYLSSKFASMRAAKQNRVLAHEFVHATQNRAAISPYTEFESETCPKKRPAGEQEASFDLPFSFNELDTRHTAQISCDGSKLGTVHNLRAWQIEGYAVNDASVRQSGTHFRAWMSKIAERQRDPNILTTDAMSHCGENGVVGYYLTAHVIGKNDCIGSNNINSSASIERETYGEKHARHNGVSVVNEFNADESSERGSLTIDTAAEINKVRSPKCYGGYPATNQTELGRRSNRSILIVELPRLSRSNGEDALIRDAEKKQRAESAQENYNDLYDNALLALSGPYKKIKQCIWSRLKANLGIAVEQNARAGGMSPPQGGAYDAYLPGTIGFGPPRGNPAAGSVTAGFESARKAHAANPATFGQRSVTDFIQPQHLTVDLYDSLTSNPNRYGITTLTAAMDQTAMRAIGGLDEFAANRLFLANAFLQDAEITHPFRLFFKNHEDDLYCCFRPDNEYYWSIVKKPPDWKIKDTSGSC